VETVESRVVVVHDHARFRSRARRILHAGGFQVVGEAVDGRGALAAVANLHPQLVLLDVRLPDLDGLEVASRLSAEPDAPVVVLMSNRDDDVSDARLGQCGARGVIAKSRLSPDLLEAVLRGGRDAAAG
jgi:DNA-binding NarL/FixJ family response regulator